MRTSTEYKEDLAVMLGGFSAEKIIFGDLTTGASNDMQQATKLARNMVMQWGMSSELGPRTYGEREDMIFLGREIHENRNYSESKAEKIDKEIDVLISEALKTAMSIIEENRDAMDRIAEHLIENEILERENFSKIAGMPPLNPKSVYKPYDDEKKGEEKVDKSDKPGEEESKKETPEPGKKEEDGKKEA